MITQSHLSLALAVLGRKSKPQYNSAIVWGALIPDITMFALLGYELLIGTPMRVIWNERYFEPLWQTVVGYSNSFPLFIAIALIGYLTKKHWFTLFGLAAILHLLFDIPLHHDDAHKHFLPFSDYKFMSPVSYWDSRHYAQYWVPVELMIIIASTYYGMRALVTNWGKILFGIVMASAILMEGMQIYRHLTGLGFD